MSRFQWLTALPTTQLRICLTMVAFLLTIYRYLFTPEPLVDLNSWLTFLTAWAVVDGGVLVGKRLSSNPEVIAAESAARQESATTTALPEGQP